MILIHLGKQMPFLLERLVLSVGSDGFLLFVESIICLFKLYLLLSLFVGGMLTPVPRYPWYCLLLVITASMIGDVAWVVKLLREMAIIEFDYRFVVFIIRLAWSLLLIEYVTFGLFLESIIEKHYRFKWYHVPFCSAAGFLFTYYVYIACVRYDHVSVAERLAFGEFVMLKITLMLIFPVVLFALFWVVRTLRQTHIPKILHQQVRMFIFYVVFPHCVCEFIASNPSEFFTRYAVIPFNNSLYGISTALFTYGIYHVTRKMIGLRFLNFKNHVDNLDRFDFIDDFKNVLEQLGHITSINEITHITQAFFKDAFAIPPSKVFFTPRKQPSIAKGMESTITTIEQFLNAHEEESSCGISSFLRSTKILIRDEIHFTHYYQEDTITKIILQFLEKTNTDIFLPIYDKQTAIGYIVIEHNARSGRFFSAIERDEMVVFASYLSNIINLLHNRNLHTLLQNEKELREELFQKHQEINQYKESIRSFLRNTKDRKIGILFYKSRRFVIGNQSAQELLRFNIHDHEGHPLAKALYVVAHHVQEYKSTQTMMTLDSQGNKLVLAGIPNLEGNNVIIMMYYPEIADLVKQQIDGLKDPSKWDYLLYLETTHAGQLINQLIPGTGENMLNFKIDLLKLALSSKPLLLEAPEEDLEAMVEILHHISLRANLHCFVVDRPEKNSKFAMHLFGINPIFGAPQTQPILETLHNNGTLFIQNIHYLAIETQEHLAEFVKYGCYREVKGDSLMVANVRIICSTDQDLETLVQDRKFSAALFNELKKSSLVMPSLLTLPEHELAALIDGFAQQAVKNQTASNLIALNDTEKNKLIYQRPVSLHEFKTKVYQMLTHKSVKNKLIDKTEFNPAYYVNDPSLSEAKQLGKRALKDRRTMTLLWQKFKNQNQIAAFLGVHRSSVNRRLSDFNLME